MKEIAVYGLTNNRLRMQDQLTQHAAPPRDISEY